MLCTHIQRLCFVDVERNFALIKSLVAVARGVVVGGASAPIVVAATVATSTSAAGGGSGGGDNGGAAAPCDGDGGGVGCSAIESKSVYLVSTRICFLCSSQPPSHQQAVSSRRRTSWSRGRRDIGSGSNGGNNGTPITGSNLVKQRHWMLCLNSAPHRTT